MTERVKLNRMRTKKGPALETRSQTDREIKTEEVKKDKGECYVFIHFERYLTVDGLVGLYMLVNFGGRLVVFMLLWQFQTILMCC